MCSLSRREQCTLSERAPDDHAPLLPLTAFAPRKAKRTSPSVWEGTEPFCTDGDTHLCDKKSTERSAPRQGHHLLQLCCNTFSFSASDFDFHDPQQNRSISSWRGGLHAPRSCCHTRSVRRVPTRGEGSSPADRPPRPQPRLQQEGSGGWEGTPRQETGQHLQKSQLMAGVTEISSTLSFVGTNRFG